jgi:outer membrane murein-binding lipoprotein Lpp
MNDPKKLKPQFDLNNIDLNSIDVDQIVQTLTQYKNAVLMAAVIIGTLIAAGMMFNNKQIKENALRKKVTQLQQKLDVIAGQKEAVKNLNDFKASFPLGINEDKIITQITSYAQAHDVIISSLTPRQKQDMGLYDVSKVDLSGAAHDYKSMVLFLRDMEKSKYLFKLDSWSGQINDSTGSIDFRLEVSVMHVHL